MGVFLSMIPSGAAATGPNIIIMQPDDLKFFDAWGTPPNNPECAAPKDLPASNGLPNIERLRTQGLQMMQAYTTSPMCGTSRFSTLTGRYPSRSAYNRDWALWLNADIANVVIPMTKLVDYPGDTLNDCSQNNMAATFQSNGYRTGMFGEYGTHTSNVHTSSNTGMTGYTIHSTRIRS